MLSRFRQRGLSMIELLVALAISSFLILGITQVYIDNKRNYVFQQSQAGNLENSRFAVLMIDDLLSKAGYRRAPDQEMLDAFPSSSILSTHCQAFPAEAALTKIKSTGGQTGFCMRYQPAVADELTCDGIKAPLSKKVFGYPSQAETIYVAVKFTPHASDLNKGTLSCISNKNTGTTPVELIDGIADMKVEFGAGQKDEKKLTASNPFKDAQSWAAADGPVRAVRYSVLAASRNNQRDSDSNIYDKWLATASAAAKTRLAAQDKKQIFQAAVGAQAIRNVMP